VSDTDPMDLLCNKIYINSFSVGIKRSFVHDLVYSFTFYYDLHNYFSLLE